MTADELRGALAALGLTQTAFATLLGVHRLTVHHWVNGVHPVPRTIELIVELLTERAGR